MDQNKLCIIGLGTFLPKLRSVAELIGEAGGDPSVHDGWPTVGVAADDEHPGNMATTALQSALEQAGVAPADLKIVVSGGVSRDYAPSWSVATEVMRNLEVPHTCLGLDTTIGCMGTLTGLEICEGWLRQNGGGYAAIVCAERWSHTIDRADPASQPLWGHSDAASALVVCLEEGLGDRRPLARYRGACFASQADYNGFILIKYGGTRHPVTPEGESPFARKLADKPASEVFQTYANGYMRALNALRERFDAKPDRIVCNQISPNFTNAIGVIAGGSPDQVCVTGKRFGHAGSADLVIGLKESKDEGKLAGNVLVAASTPYAFGAGLLVA